MKKNPSNGPPQLIPINHDDYHAKYIGTLADGRQFFLASPFVPLGHEFVALYLFDAQGKLLEATIDDLGTREQVDNEKYHALYHALIETRLKELGEFTFGDIEVAPFSVERFDTKFGLIPNPPEEEGAFWWVELQPGNYMAFAPPWDGFYDT